MAGSSWMAPLFSLLDDKTPRNICFQFVFISEIYRLLLVFQLLSTVNKYIFPR
jgi:hypothetical protein